MGKPVALNDYIARHYEGNQSAMARALGVRRDQVGRYIQQGCFVEDGKLKRTEIVRKLPKPPRK